MEEELTDLPPSYREVFNGPLPSPIRVNWLRNSPRNSFDLPSYDEAVYGFLTPTGLSPALSRRCSSTSNPSIHQHLINVDEELFEITLEIPVPQTESEVETRNEIVDTNNLENIESEEELEMASNDTIQLQTPSAPEVHYGWSNDTLLVPSCFTPPPLPPRTSSRSPSRSPLRISPSIIFDNTVGATLAPFQNFCVNTDVCQIKYALDDKDKDKLIDILCHRTFDQRNQIAELFSILYGIPLAFHIQDTFSNPSDFVTLMTGLSMPIHEFFADTIYTSHSNIWMCYLIFILPNAVRFAMKEFFKLKYKLDMVEYLRNKSLMSVSHPDDKILPQMINLIISSRDDNTNINMNTIRAEVRVLMDVQKENAIRELAKSIFYQKSFQHIVVLSNEYYKATGQTIGMFIEKTFRRSAFTILNIAIYAKYPEFYYASVLKKSKKIRESHKFLLSSCIMLSCETHMIYIKRRFKREYGKSLRNWISGETWGHYKYALYELIGEKRSIHYE